MACEQSNLFLVLSSFTYWQFRCRPHNLPGFKSRFQVSGKRVFTFPSVWKSACSLDCFALGVHVLWWFLLSDWFTAMVPCARTGAIRRTGPRTRMARGSRNFMTGRVTTCPLNSHRLPLHRSPPTRTGTEVRCTPTRPGRTSVTLPQSQCRSTANRSLL